VVNVWLSLRISRPTESNSLYKAAPLQLWDALAKCPFNQMIRYGTNAHRRNLLFSCPSDSYQVFMLWSRESAGTCTIRDCKWLDFGVLTTT
jgi:hypothetical protein